MTIDCLLVPLQVMPYSTGLSTTLSNNEAAENYKDAQDPAVMVRVLLSVCYCNSSLSSCSALGLQSSCQTCILDAAGSASLFFGS